MSLFGQSSGGSAFGQPNQQQQQQQQQSSGLFGSTQQKPNLFGSLNTNPATSQPQQQGGGLFGSTSQPAQGGGLFGTSQPQQGGGLFGSSQPQQQSGGNVFGSQGGGLFGSSQPQQQRQGGGLFGSSQPQQQTQGGGLFGNLGGASNQQPQQQQSQAQQQPGSVLGQSQYQSRLFQTDLAPRQKSVIDQIELAYTKWNPSSPNTPFRTYLYNAVPVESVPFYGPTAADDEAKWEEALAKKPIPGSIPILVRGFEELGLRMRQQLVNLQVLQGRLHEINEGLSMLLQKHDLQISIRAAECRRRHQRLAKQCLILAAKTQVLRNRGFAMNPAEETLRQKLLALERSVMDPALNGRSEEIWARMVGIRERSRQLQRELERAGDLAGQEGAVVIDEEVMKRAKKILEDYASQLSHLSKELAQIQKDWANWESSKPSNDPGHKR